jgi:subtilase family serine protease
VTLKSKKKIISILMVLGFLFSTMAVLSGTDQVSGMITHSSGSQNKSIENNLLISSNLVPLRNYVNTSEKYSIKSPREVNTTNSNKSESILVGFQFSNLSELVSLLSNISNKNSPQYHRYISRAQFERRFEPSDAIYNNFIKYLQSNGIYHITTYKGRSIVTFTSTTKLVDKMFRVKTEDFVNGSQNYYAAVGVPKVPSYFNNYVTSIIGLSNYSQYVMSLNLQHKVAVQKNASVKKTPQGNIISPACYDGTQYFYAPEFQSAYNERTLFREYGYPTSSVEATILWGGEYNGTNTSTPYGTLTHDERVGSFVPSNVYCYFNETMPAGEPHAKVVGVPLNGAVSPGPLAQYDSTGANFENTLDMEMLGSTAPGSTIYNVYGNSSSYYNINLAFNYILNPGSKSSKLNNVSVISNSWGGCNVNCTSFCEDDMEAQARGITVLASSGDAGDNANSTKWVGTNVEFPSVLGYNNFGVVAVGGTTFQLNATSNIESQRNWYVPEGDKNLRGPYGTSSGIDTCLKEPTWQKDSSANLVIKGEGRGVPDISAIANDTLVTISISGYTYDATNATYGGRFEYAWGTSIASPVTAGILSEIDSVLYKNNDSRLGFLDSLLYKLGNEQFEKESSNSTTGYIDTGTYNSTLPALPFYPVETGRNHIYHARYGYSLLDGWGSINAYNLTIYTLKRNFRNNNSDLLGIDNNLTLKSLDVSSYNSTGSLNRFYNASVQQNLFLANEMGQPLYWIQNVIYLNKTVSGGYVVNYTGWVNYPFYGIYQTSTVYHYTFPSGRIILLPHSFNISTQLNVNGNPMDSYLKFFVNRHEIKMNVTGAAFIIGARNYSYYYENNLIYNGPYPNNKFQGGLDPQFGLVGGPSAYLGIFRNSTTAYVKSYIENEEGHWIVPRTRSFNESIDQTGENATNLIYSPNGTGCYSIGIKPGSKEQGLVFYTTTGREKFKLDFLETNLTDGTVWNLTFEGKKYSSNLNNITVYSVNGTYTYEAENTTLFYNQNFHKVISVSGKNITVQIIYIRYSYIHGTVSPSDTTLSFNGKNVQISGNGQFNITTTYGSFVLKASSPGFKTKYMNFTVQKGKSLKLNISLSEIKQHGPNYIYLYLTLILLVIITVIAVAINLKRRR